MTNWKKIGFITAFVVLGVAFVMSGLTKLAGQDPNPANFETWGYPSWMMYVVGAGEATFALMLFLPKTRFYGAALLILNMAGAAVTHITAGEYTMIGPSLVLGGLAFLVAWLTLPAIVAQKLNREPGPFA
jgi:uncharacterized membrane protein YphA (DoxX/SURF4 family)